jgi:hypothetical protein
VTTVASATCALCGRASDQAFQLGSSSERGCSACAQKLGRLLTVAPELLSPVWPLLLEEDDGSPEPRVRLADGRSVELRERTAELKRDLSVDERMRLAAMFGELGLAREQLLEAGFVLSTGPSDELAQRALDLIFSDDRASARSLELLRTHLLPS